MNKLMAKKSSSLAKTIGQGLALLQDGVDYAVESGCKALKKMSEKKAKPKKDENKYLRTAKKFGKGTMNFLGIVGDEYYKKYEKIKAEKAKR